jgi:hypothetical protein
VTPAWIAAWYALKARKPFALGLWCGAASTALAGLAGILITLWLTR